MSGGPVTLRLTNVSEQEALHAILGSVAYVAVTRLVGEPGASAYRRILLLATSKAPIAAASTSKEADKPAPPLPIPTPVSAPRAEAEPERETEKSKDLAGGEEGSSAFKEAVPGSMVAPNFPWMNLSDPNHRQPPSGVTTTISPDAFRPPDVVWMNLAPAGRQTPARVQPPALLPAPGGAPAPPPSKIPSSPPSSP